MKTPISLQFTFLFAAVACALMCGPVHAGWQKDMVLGTGGERGSSGGNRSDPAPEPRGPSRAETAARHATYLEAVAANDRGNEFLKKRDYRRALEFYEEAARKKPNDTGIQANIALAQAGIANDRGNVLLKKGDYGRALELYEEAARISPDDKGIQANVALAQKWIQRIQIQRDAAEKAVQDRHDAAENARLTKERNIVAVADIRQTINNFTETLTAAPAASDGSDSTPGLPAASASPGPAEAALEFGDPTKRGAFGSQESNARFATAERKKTGTDTNPGDQLKSAAAEAAKGSQSDLTTNYDIGGAPNARSLDAAYTFSAGPPPMDLSHFSERAKKDPEIVAGLNRLSGLESRRIELDAQRTQLTNERVKEKVPSTMQKMTRRLDLIEKTYQTNLMEITEKTQEIEKRKRFIDNSVEGAPIASGTDAK